MENYELEHIAQLRALASECMVLLKTDGKFPLTAPGKIALYGSGARNTIKGGTGSGDVNVRSCVTVEQGLENAGFTVTTKDWLIAYQEEWNKARAAFTAEIRERILREGMSAIMLGIGAVMPEPEYEIPMNGEGDTAVYVLGRVSGEGSDRRALPGDFELTQTEIRDILYLQNHYEKFLLVLNVGGVVDLTPVAEQVGNILLLGQTGMTIGDSFADVLLGKTYPSGKLASTWAAWQDYNHAGDFGEADDTHYREGIYVGYRYFDSVGKEPLFPFGYGMGYTQFAWNEQNVSLNGTEVSVSAEVKNIGKFPGKEVLQLYVSVPSGKLDQPYKTLAAFAKTKELQPGESEILTLTVDIRSIASFDTESACSILEQGDYILHLGNSSRDTKAVGIVRLDGNVVVQKLSNSGGTPDFTDWKPEKPNLPATENVPVLALAAADIPQIERAQPQIDPKATELAKSLTDEELAYVCVGGFRDEGSKSFIGNAGMQVAGAAGETTSILLSRDVPNLIMADGPAGLRLAKEYGVDAEGVYAVDNGSLAAIAEVLPAPIMAALGIGSKKERHGEIFHQYCSAIPVGTALAQSWNIALCEECGDLVGKEMERFHVHIWLAPALNIHRFPLCGRNFEYYSEDPLISGKMAAAITRGVQRHPGRGVSIKHYCCNNQETNRMYSNSQVSQRALREIYLKGFEIAVRESQPATVMSSYNLLNGVHTSSREDLMETVLRQEWGFEGIVMSDWVTPGFGSTEHKYPYANAQGSIRAGNDIMMPGGRLDHSNLMAALAEESNPYHIIRETIEKCAARVIALAWKLGR